MASRSFLFLFILALAGIQFSCGTEISKKEGKISRLLDPDNFDSSVRPADDFFLFANGNWLQKNPIPAHESRWGSLSVLEENNQQVLHELLEIVTAQGATQEGTPEQKASDFYRSGMDTVAIEKAGLNPLQPLLFRINACTGTEAIWNEILKEHTEGFKPAFSFSIQPDDQNTDRTICKFYQGGMGMPEPEDYYKDGPYSEALRKRYKSYAAALFSLAGEDSAAAIRHSELLFSLESVLAKASMRRIDRQAVHRLYHKYLIGDADKLTPGIRWQQMLGSLGIKNEQEVILAQPGFFATLSGQLKGAPVEAWKAYLRFHVLSTMAPFLARPYRNAHFDFYNRAIRGQQTQRQRWKFVLTVLDGSIGELIGQMYVSKTFRPETRYRMEVLVNNIQKTFRERIGHMVWMNPETRLKAQMKLDAITKKIGYPELAKDYSGLHIDRDRFAANVIAAASFHYRSSIGKLGKPVDRKEWDLTAPTVNAYYNLTLNEIVFPAGMLQYSANFKMTEDLERYEIVLPGDLFGKPGSLNDSNGYKIILPSGSLQYPYFIENADDAVNYGSIGAFIAHEMTHGFDDRGRHYDEKGELNNWWLSEDEMHFRAKATMLAEQFSSFAVLDTVHVNGALTSGENIADLGGLVIAYEAFKKTKQGKENKKIDGFTPDQRFFLSWAQLWRVASRDEETIRRIRTDHHAPYQWRCNGTLRNFSKFYEAFGVRKGDRMFLPEALRVSIW
jgi:putative endopeptidase